MTDKKNVLVTGGAGYVGSHACKALEAAGFVPVTFDNLSTGWRDSVKFGPLVEGDLLDKKSVDEVFLKYKPIAVMHFAALSQVGESVKLPGHYWENNLVGSLNLIQKAVDHGCMNFIFSSTCATYGDQSDTILDENCTQQPLNAYGASKLGVENILRNYSVSSGLTHVIFRYFNVAGADKNVEIGEFHRPETHLIPAVLKAIYEDNKSESFIIYGTDYDTPDGTCIRDYVHVCDIVDAHILGLNWLLHGRENRVFNLGTGSGFSVREVIDCIKSVTNQKLNIIEGARRVGDCRMLVSGSTRAEIELGWSARRSSLSKMIYDAWRWQQHGGYKK